ncbi:MAG: hypothetical protein ABL907_18135, partial [Hyphomicrobium sp.]
MCGTIALSSSTFCVPLDAIAAAQSAKAAASNQADSIDSSGHLIKILGSAGMLNEATAEVAEIHAL